MVNGALKTYFTRLIMNNLKSPAMYAGGLGFIGGFMGLIGAYFAKAPFYFWFPIVYLMFTFSFAGGLARSMAIGAAAFYYITRHGGC
jgi:hypothetical protein